MKAGRGDGKRKTAGCAEIVDVCCGIGEGIYEWCDGTLLHAGIACDDGAIRRAGGWRYDGADGSEEPCGGASIAKVELYALRRRGKVTTRSRDNEGLAIVGPLKGGCLRKDEPGREEDEGTDLQGLQGRHHDLGVIRVKEVLQLDGTV